jgi:hypothetical protein
MTTRLRATIAVFLAIAFVQLGLVASTAAPVPFQALVAKLTTRGSAPRVNNASAASGASILTGSTIETPAASTATVKIGRVGTVTVKPNSSIQLDFDESGNVRVKVLRGCVRMQKNGPGEAEAYTAEGASEKTNSTRKAMGFCYFGRQADTDEVNWTEDQG